MSGEQDSWFKAAFGVDLAAAAEKLRTEAGAALGHAKVAVEQAVASGAAAEGSFPLGGSVGRKGKNAPGDVRAVQQALGIAIDGECGPRTIEAIEAFQRHLGATKPDGRVDAGGATERALAGLPRTSPAPTSPAGDSTGATTSFTHVEPDSTMHPHGSDSGDERGDLVDDLLQQQAALVQSLGNAGSDAEAARIREELAGVSDELGSELAALKAEGESEAPEATEEDGASFIDKDESYNEDLNVQAEEAYPWVGERPLTADERGEAQKIYQDSIDYDKVTIKAGSLGSAGASRTIGNTICLVDEKFHDNTDSLTPEGLATLIHELGHVWQYQHGGATYAADALWAQAVAVVTTGDRNDAYDWRRAVREGTDWKDWNAEQQAEAMEAYFIADTRIEAAKAAGTAPDPADVDVVRTLEKYRTRVRSGQGAPGGPSRELGDFVLPRPGDSGSA